MIILSLLINISYCTVIGVDLGSYSIKVAIGSPQKGVHRVRNYFLHDTTPNIFTYIDQSKWAYGEGAIAQCRVYPETCIQNQKLPLNNKLYFNSLEGYQITAISIKQIIHNIVNKLQINKSSLNVVIAIPPSMTDREKSFLCTSLSISSFNCIRFITTTYAPIETYVNEKKDHIGNNAVFIDIGHEGVRISGFEFDQKKITQKLGLFRDNSGGKRIDENLMKMLIKRHSLIISNPAYVNENDYDYNHEYLKNKVLLLAQIRKAREELTEKPVFKFEYKNIEITITRKDLEICCNETKEALNSMLTILKQNHQYLLRSGDIHIIGGCSRIPCLQTYIKELLPSITIVQQMKKILSICKGACYVIDSETGSSIQRHNALVFNNEILQAKSKNYVLFNHDNYEDYNPVIQFRNVDRNLVFHVIDKINNSEFTRFTINYPDYDHYHDKVELGFTLSNYLIPVPDSPLLIEKNGAKSSLSVDYIETGWEVLPQKLTDAKRIINLLSRNFNQNFKVELNSTEIEKYRNFVQEKLKKYFVANWRRVSFTAIYLNIKSKFNTCIKENEYDCPQNKLNQILDDFKSAVKSLKIDGLDEFEEKFVYKDSMQIAIHNLNSLLLTCKNIGAKYDDVEQWMNKNLVTASIIDVNRYIGILKERAKIAEMSNHEEL